MLKIVVDENIPFAYEAFSTLGEVFSVNGREIDNDFLLNKDILLIRSVTKVNKNLLKNTSIKFVGSATIGFDHIDLDYLSSNGISFTNAKGCNSHSVAEYVIAALLNTVEEDENFNNLTAGIIGYGNIGKLVYDFFNAVGIKCLVNDPPLQEQGFNFNFSTFEETLKCDIVTLHTPLTYNLKYKTYHLLNSSNLNLLKRNAVLINSSRGEVVDNIALLQALEEKNLRVVLDVWEKEPDINTRLVHKVKFGTPHIAGYSYEGKVNGTRILFNKLCSFLDVVIPFDFVLPEVQNNILKFEDLKKVINQVYDINEDHNNLKDIAELNGKEKFNYFDRLRRDYRIRREFTNYKVESEQHKEIFKKLRFKV